MAAFKTADPSILIAWKGNGGFTASNISENTFTQLQFITHDPANNASIAVTNVAVSIPDITGSFGVPGLTHMVQQHFGVSSFSAYSNNSKTHVPFSNGFNGTPAGLFIDTVTSSSPTLPNTANKSKKMSMDIIDPSTIGAAVTAIGNMSGIGDLSF